MFIVIHFSPIPTRFIFQLSCLSFPLIFNFRFAIYYLDPCCINEDTQVTCNCLDEAMIDMTIMVLFTLKNVWLGFMIILVSISLSMLNLDYHTTQNIFE